MKESICKSDVPIRVLCVFGALDHGGAETMCMDLYRHINREKIQFDFIKHTPKNCAFDDEIRSLGGRIFVAPKLQGWNLLSYLMWWNRHLKAHPEHQIIHGHYYTISGVYFFICKKHGRTTIAHSHNTNTRISRDHKLIEKVMIRILNRYSDICFACSQAAGEFLFPGRSFTVLKNAIDANQFRFAPATRELVRKEMELEGCFVVGTVGRLVPQKNPGGIIDIFAELYKRNPSAMLLWIGDGELRQEIESTIKERGLQKHIILTGVRSDVNDMLQAMDVFILPSLYEGLGIAAIEAQASGLPCFCSDSIPREAAVTRLCQFLPLDNPGEWVKAVEHADLTRKDTIAEIVAAGYDIYDTSRFMESFYLQLARSD